MEKFAQPVIELTKEQLKLFRTFQTEVLDTLDITDMQDPDRLGNIEGGSLNFAVGSADATLAYDVNGDVMLMFHYFVDPEHAAIVHQHARKHFGAVMIGPSYLDCSPDDNSVVFTFEPDFLHHLAEHFEVHSYTLRTILESDEAIENKEPDSKDLN